MLTTTHTAVLDALTAGISPEQQSSILSALTDPNRCLDDIAHQHALSLDALALWLSRPDAQARIAALDAALARQLRLRARHVLHTAIDTLYAVISNARHEERSPADPHPSAASERRQSRNTLNRSLSILLDIARLDTTPTPANPRPVNDRPSPTRITGRALTALLDEPAPTA